MLLPRSGDLDKEKPITAGFYRQEKGETLTYTYTYHEMKIIVEGEFHISDGTNSYVGLPGDVFYFREFSSSSLRPNSALIESRLAEKGDTITFSSPDYGLGFFVGAKAWGVI